MNTISSITVKGARQHNLKNVSVTLPKNSYVVVTGVSGSGKSSFAFDTLYAEGQRRYVESLSAYARQFLGIMDKPDVDSVDGLSPAISIDQKTTSHNPRSTVGTITELYDYFRLLYARVGHPHCPKCGKEIAKLSVDEITKKIMTSISSSVFEGTKPKMFFIYSPVVRSKKGEFRDLFASILSKGFREVKIDGKLMAVSEDISLIKTNKHSISVRIDTVSVQKKYLKDPVYCSNLTSRVRQAVEQSTQLSDGLVQLEAETEELFSEHFSCPTCSMSLPELEPRMFSFNSPLGACETCKGIGLVYRVDPKRILNVSLSILEGGILPFNKLFFHETWYIRLLKQALIEEDVRLDVAIGKLTEEELELVLKGTKKTYKVRGTNRYGRSTVIYEQFDGVIAELERRYTESTHSESDYDLQKYVKEEECSSCKGLQLRPEILSVTVDGKHIMEMSHMSIEKLKSYTSTKLLSQLSEYEQIIARPIVKEINTRLSFLVSVGLSYLTIGRKAKTLSGGELQRIRLASQIGSGLTGVMYVLDEPSIGLHPRDVASLITSLRSLVELGNTLIIVEHDPETIRSADHVLELGPYAGKEGGYVTFQGTVPELLKDKKSITGKYLTGKREVEFPKRKLVNNQGTVVLRGASQFNLKHITARFPLGNLIAVTGVSGSGKSTLVVETLYPALRYHLDGFFSEEIGAYSLFEGWQYVKRSYLVDQSPIGRTPRSNPATYVGFFDEIRDIFAQTTEARMRGFAKGRFSFNIKGGRCEKCQGAGVIRIEMQFLSDVYVQCDVCAGRRYNTDTLSVTFKGKTISDVLAMTVDEAFDFFQNHFRVANKLSFLKKVGLGYITIGQPAPTFSGGEAQRMKLAHELARTGSGSTIYILDEPTTGLHMYDVEKLLHTLFELVQKGNTVIVIEHNLDVIRHCQYVIDLGPDGGEAGGQVVYQGETDGIYEASDSVTGKYLKK